MGLSSAHVATAHKPRGAAPLAGDEGQEGTFEASVIVWNCASTLAAPGRSSDPARFGRVCEADLRAVRIESVERRRTDRCSPYQPHYSEQFLRPTAHPYLQQHSSLAWRQQWAKDGGDAARPQIGSSAARDAAAAIREGRQQR